MGETTRQRRRGAGGVALKFARNARAKEEETMTKVTEAAIMKGVNHSNQTALVTMCRARGRGDFVFRNMNYSQLPVQMHSLEIREPAREECLAHNVKMQRIFGLLYREDIFSVFISTVIFRQIITPLVYLSRSSRVIFHVWEYLQTRLGIIEGGMICHWKCREHMMILNAATCQATRLVKEKRNGRKKEKE